MRGVWRPQAGTRPLDGRVRALPRAEPGWHSRETLGFLHSDCVFVLRVGLASTSARYVGAVQPALCSILRLRSSLSPSCIRNRPSAGFLPEASSSQAPQLRRETTVFAGLCLDLALAAEGQTARADCGHTRNATTNDEVSSTCKRSNV
jgi:hypothetical protein